MESIERWDKSLDQWDKQIYIYMYIYIYLGKFDHDLSVPPNPGIMVNEGNHPLLWPPDSCGE